MAEIMIPPSGDAVPLPEPGIKSAGERQTVVTKRVFRRGFRNLTAAQSPADLSAHPIRWVLMDDVNFYPSEPGFEDDEPAYELNEGD